MMLLKVRFQAEMVAQRKRSTSETEKTLTALIEKLPVMNETMRKMARMEHALEMIVSCTIPTNISNVSISDEYE